MKIEISHTELLNLSESLGRAQNVVQGLIESFYKDKHRDLVQGDFVVAWDNNEHAVEFAQYMGCNPESEYSFICYRMSDTGEPIELGRNYKNARKANDEETNRFIKLTGAIL